MTALNLLSHTFALELTSNLPLNRCLLTVSKDSSWFYLRFTTFEKDIYEFCYSTLADLKKAVRNLPYITHTMKEKLRKRGQYSTDVWIVDHVSIMRDLELHHFQYRATLSEDSFFFDFHTPEAN